MSKNVERCKTCVWWQRCWCINPSVHNTIGRAVKTHSEQSCTCHKGKKRD